MLTGVGKANAAGGVACVLDPDRHAGVLNAGIAGLLPQTREGPGLGSAVLATRSVFGDDGILSPDGFRTFADAGFPIVDQSDAIEPFAGWAEVLAELVEVEGGIATVSTCSSTDAQAREIAARTGAVAEACEGAGCGLSAFRAGCPFAEIRTISNTTGDRDNQRWDIPGALERLEELFGNADLADRLIGSAADARAD